MKGKDTDRGSGKDKRNSTLAHNPYLLISGDEDSGDVYTFLHTFTYTHTTDTQVTLCMCPRHPCTPSHTRTFLHIHLHTLLRAHTCPRTVARVHTPSRTRTLLHTHTHGYPRTLQVHALTQTHSPHTHVLRGGRRVGLRRCQTHGRPGAPEWIHTKPTRVIDEVPVVLPRPRRPRTCSRPPSESPGCPNTHLPRPLP